MRPLEETQREFFAALQMPLRGRSRASTELPANEEGHSAEFLAKADELMKSGANLSSAERLELYHRQYWFRVLDSVAEDFPILQKVAGEETFWALLEAYLLACPSESFTLRHLGSRLPDFAAGWEGVEVARRRWFSALARLEYAEMEIYEAAAWQPVPPEELATAKLGLQPHVILLDLPVPADLCTNADSFPPAAEEPIRIAVWRGERAEACRCRLDPVEFVLLQRLREGGTLVSLFTEPTEREPTPEEVSQWFANWQGRGWIGLAPDAAVEDFPVVRHAGVRDMDWSRIDKMGSQARAMEDD